MSDGDLTPKPLKIRKQRQGDQTTPTHRFNHENGLAKLLLSNPACNASTVGMVETGRATSQRAMSTQPELIPDLRRQTSFRHRLLTRVISGLTTRSQSKSIDEEDEAAGRRLSTARTSRDASRSSSASSGLNPYDLNDLDRVLAAFPTPPTSSMTTPATERSLDSVDLQLPTYRELSLSSHDVVVAAELRIVPYQAHSNADQSTLVAVEISATWNQGLHIYEPQSAQSAVNSIVVIDNSLYNSPASLIASCEVARLLALCLNTTHDRFGVLCTVSADADDQTGDPKVILPLSRVNSRKLKTNLDRIAISTAQPVFGAMTAALKKARRMLEESEQLLADRETTQDTFGHIFILTADTSVLNEKDINHSAFQTHILCPGLPQQKQWDAIVCNGWKMNIFSASLSKDHFRRHTSVRNRDPHSLNSKLQALVRLAHLGKLTHELTSVRLDVVPRSGFNVEKTMGQSTFARLRCGEVKTLIFRLLPAGDISVIEKMDSSKQRNLIVSPSGDDLIAELDRMLGLPKDGTMTAKLKYSHSSLPANTTCMTTARCLLHTPRPPSPQDERLPHEPTASENNILVDQRLAEHYATSYEARDALFCLHQEFGDGGCRSACPAYVTAVTDELRYQARIYERIAIENSPKNRSKPLEAPHPGTRVDDWGVPTLYRKDPKPRHSRESISLPTKIIPAPRLAPMRITEQLGLDEAMRIWNDLRKMSRSDKSESQRKQSISLAGGERAKRVTESVLTHERSIRESGSFRSLSMPEETSTARGLSAPWL